MRNPSDSYLWSARTLHTDTHKISLSYDNNHMLGVGKVTVIWPEPRTHWLHLLRCIWPDADKFVPWVWWWAS